MWLLSLLLKVDTQADNRRTHLMVTLGNIS